MCDEPTPPATTETLADSPPGTADYWRHRRAMTYLALGVGLFLFPLACGLQPALFGLSAPVYTLVTTIVAAYMGTSYLDDNRKKRSDA